MPDLPRIYLDACALNRPTDPQGQLRIVLESAAVLRLLHAARARRVSWIASTVLIAEIENNPDVFKRRSVLGLLQFASEIHRPSEVSADRGRQLNLAGYGKLDALHLAMAEEHGCGLLLTTDDRFVRQAQRGLGAPAVRVENPLNYLKEAPL
jgi:predicted nucleic acid-binding protein